jgi:hypothetical protein
MCAAQRRQVADFVDLPSRDFLPRLRARGETPPGAARERQHASSLTDGLGELEQLARLTDRRLGFARDTRDSPYSASFLIASRRPRAFAASSPPELLRYKRDCVPVILAARSFAKRAATCCVVGGDPRQHGVGRRDAQRCRVRPSSTNSASSRNLRASASRLRACSGVHDWVRVVTRRARLTSAEPPH